MPSKIACAFVVMSGKGGVGKSSIASQLALALLKDKKRVGLLDLDICGPSLAKMMNVLDGQIVQTEFGWKPVKVFEDKELYLTSMAFLINDKNSAIIWRGPKKHSMIEKFVTGVDWGQLDYLIIDTPPGTSDEHISLVELMRQEGIPFKAILITTPQIVACNDVRREITFCKTSGVEMVGIIENMSGYTCPYCDECTKIFSSKGGEHLSILTNVKFLGAIPIEPNLCKSTESGKNFMDEYNDSKTAKSILSIVDNITRQDMDVVL